MILINLLLRCRAEGITDTLLKVFLRSKLDVGIDRKAELQNNHEGDQSKLNLHKENNLLVFGASVLGFQIVISHTALVLNITGRMVWLKDVRLEVFPDNIEHGNPIKK